MLIGSTHLFCAHCVEMGDGGDASRLCVTTHQSCTHRLNPAASSGWRRVPSGGFCCVVTVAAGGAPLTHKRKRAGSSPGCPSPFRAQRTDVSPVFLSFLWKNRRKIHVADVTPRDANNSESRPFVYCLRFEATNMSRTIPGAFDFRLTWGEAIARPERFASVFPRFPAGYLPGCP